MSIGLTPPASRPVEIVVAIENITAAQGRWGQHLRVYYPPATMFSDHPYPLAQFAARRLCKRKASAPPGTAAAGGELSSVISPLAD